MKKTLIFLTALFTATMSIAEGKKSFSLSDSPNSEQETRPFLVVGGLDENSKVKAIDINMRSFSKKQLNYQLCWAAFNLPQVSKTDLVITITSEKPSTFNLNKISSKNKTTHTFYDSAVLKNHSTGSCWKFEQHDPVGQYTITIQAGDIKFPTQGFEITN